MTLDTAPYRATPPIDLSSFDTRDTTAFDEGKKAGKKAHEELNARLELLQEQLYAQGKHRLLIVLQATDTGGKDGTIRRVFEGVNPQGVDVASFKKPTSVELAHDYLWRIHKHVPADGRITIFNRSHYEDVLVVRVHDLVPEDRWSKRYEHIRNFEQMLVDEGTTILKFFLHISNEEQKERLEARLENPDKHWKFSLGDLDERKRWDDYQQAFETMINETSTPDAPWYVVPADRKWYRDLVISSTIIQTLESLGVDWPEAESDYADVEVI